MTPEYFLKKETSDCGMGTWDAESGSCLLMHRDGLHGSLHFRSGIVSVYRYCGTNIPEKDTKVNIGFF